MRISDYCRLLLKKYSYDENLSMLITLLKEAWIMRDTITGIEVIPWENPKTGRKLEAHVTGGVNTASKLVGGVATSVEGNVYLKVIPGTHNIKQMLVVLAHELGHVISLKEKGSIENQDRYIALLNEAQFIYTLLGDKLGWEYIMAEEMTAWAHARIMLQSIGWTDWAYFDAQRKDCLATYDYCGSFLDG